MPNSIFWFRRDLRLRDNPGLNAAIQHGKVLCVYILDDIETKGSDSTFSQLGSGTKAWLHYALESLNKSLGGKLYLSRGDPTEVLRHVASKASAKKVFCNHVYEPQEFTKEASIRDSLQSSAGISLTAFNASVLWEPNNILDKNRKPFKVFTQFYRNGCLPKGHPRPPQDKPKDLPLLHLKSSLALDELDLLSKDSPNLTINSWTISEEGALDRLNNFLRNGLPNYKKGRDFPSEQHVSRLSPYLRFGQISPHTIWHSTVQAGAPKPDSDHFCSELGWREFSIYLLHHFPSLPREGLDPKFKEFPWKSDDKALTAWKEGRTGVPLVDAGMRELLQTGYMHNRLRQVVASYLVKNLMIHWHEGEEWFWEKLLDADLASNSASWQWVAGCGADAANYVRIFNPMLQSQKYDPEGKFIKTYVPELASVPTKYIFAPWEATDTAMKNVGVTMGVTYPRPLVDFNKSKQEVLKKFDRLSG